MLIGIVGRPNTGKSTFFKAATLADVLIANYPFATIKPNRAIAYIKIPDLAAEFGKVSNPREGYVKKGNRFVPFEIMDVAGLVEGASEGKGLGNQFLDDLTSADALIHVVDMSGETDSEGKPTSGYYPGKDIKIIEDELDKWYLGILNKVWKTMSRNLIVQKTEFAEGISKQFSGLKVSEDDVKEVVLKISSKTQVGKAKSSSEKTGANDDDVSYDNNDLDFSNPSTWDKEQLMAFARALRKYTKPMIIVANKIDRPNGPENYQKIKDEFSYLTVPCFAEGELALKEADKAGLIDYIPGDKDFEVVGQLTDKQTKALDDIKKTMKQYEGTGVQEVLNKTVLDLLKYIAVFPAGSKLADSKGNILPDCYLMPSGSTALDFAYKLHSDIGNNFIKAIDIRTKKAVGKDYKLKHCDGLEIMTK